MGTAQTNHVETPLEGASSGAWQLAPHFPPPYCIPAVCLG